MDPMGRSVVYCTIAWKQQLQGDGLPFKSTHLAHDVSNRWNSVGQLMDKGVLLEFVSFTDD